VLTRFGPMFQVERMGGAFVLAAMRVPEADYERVLGAGQCLPQVAHNYRREHALNMWFVLATETKAGMPRHRAHRGDTGLPVYAFPKEREYFVEMKLEAAHMNAGGDRRHRPAPDRRHPGGLPLVPRRITSIAGQLGI
jgi:hypothetical protein